MDANKAIKLGFADELMQRSASTDEVPVPQVSMMFSRTAVLNSLMDKNAAKCKIKARPTQTETKVKAGSLMDRLNFVKNSR